MSQFGTRLPGYASGLGKVLLAYLDPAEFRRRIAKVKFERFTSRTVPTPSALEEGLAEIRMRGFGEDEGEYTPGVFCVAVPIFGAKGENVAAMSCSSRWPGSVAPTRNAPPCSTLYPGTRKHSRTSSPRR